MLCANQQTMRQACADSRCVGDPLPGVTVKLVPADDDTYEIRVSGTLVTPGYFRRPDLAGHCFEAEGFYCLGDAVNSAEPDNPPRGCCSAAPPPAPPPPPRGESRPRLRDGMAQRGGNARYARRANQAGGPVLHSPQLEDHLGPVLARLNPDSGSAARIARLIVMAQPPSLDAGEITDKGYVNQRQHLAISAGLVELLYAEPAPCNVIRPSTQEIE